MLRTLLTCCVFFKKCHTYLCLTPANVFEKIAFKTLAFREDILREMKVLLFPLMCFHTMSFQYYTMRL